MTWEREPIEWCTGDGHQLVGWGAGDGPAVVLLHAGGERAAVWEPVVEAMVDRRAVRCVAPDLRGHGGSEGVAERVGDLGADVGRIIEGLDGPVLLVGSSLGGVASIEALRDSDTADRVAALVLVDVVPDPDPDRARRYLTERELIDRNRSLIENVLETGPDRLEVLRTADVPVLLVRASRSVLDDADIGRLACAASELVTTTVDATHLIARDAPSALATVIISAIDRWLLPGPASAGREGRW